MSTSIIGFGQSTPATTFSLSQVEGAQTPSGGPQPPPVTLSAIFADSRVSTDTYTQSQAASALLASTVSPASTPPVAAAASTTAISTQTVTAQAQNPATTVVQNATSDTNYVQQFEQAEAPPPYTLATAAPNPVRDNNRQLTPVEFTPFQTRQFSDLLKSIRSITSAVLPNFAYSV